jgi:hypothetical protein
MGDQTRRLGDVRATGSGGRWPIWMGALMLLVTVAVIASGAVSPMLTW